MKLETVLTDEYLLKCYENFKLEGKERFYFKVKNKGYCLEINRCQNEGYTHLILVSVINQYQNYGGFFKMLDYSDEVFEMKLRLYKLKQIME